jgi:type IV pilus assembly protein PilO
MSLLDDLRDRPGGQKAALVGALVLVAAVVDWNYWYGPERRALTQLTTQTSALRAELDTKRSKANARASAERELRDLAAELRRAEARLPDQREIADLLSSVAGSARGVGLDIVLFRQKPEVYHDFYADVPVEMAMRGTYHDVALFLDRVKRLDRIVNVSDMQLKKPRVEGERVILEGSCTATTFRFLDEAERQRLQEQKKGSKQPKPGGKKGARTT